jgi:hypothetical protein
MGFTHLPTGHEWFTPVVRLWIRLCFGRFLDPFPELVGFFEQTFARFCPDTFGGLLCDEMGHLLHIFWVWGDVLLHVRLFGAGELGRTSTSLVIIPSGKTSRGPGIQPVIERQTLHSKNLHACMRGHALETQQNTMGTWPDAMLWTVLRPSTEYALGFRA